MQGEQAFYLLPQFLSGWRLGAGSLICPCVAPQRRRCRNGRGGHVVRLVRSTTPPRFACSYNVLLGWYLGGPGQPPLSYGEALPRCAW